MTSRDAPLVSVVTATWQRAALLAGRCVPSVQGQAWPNAEHIIVSDGPDPELARAAAMLGTPSPGTPPIRFAQLAEHNPAAHFGHRARVVGLGLARGDFIAYLDDDAWRPDHLATAMRALLDSGRRVRLYLRDDAPARIGDGPLARGRFLPSAMVHRRELLDIATWQDEPRAPDWELVRRWHEAGVRHVSVNSVTVDYYPGVNGFRGRRAGLLPARVA